jgi:hypothetical protein
MSRVRHTFPVVVALALLAGCGGGAKIYPTSGKVTVNGTPAAGALVILHQVGNPDTMDKKPSGLTKEDGTFVLNTNTADDGAAAGEYYVTVIWAGKPKPAGQPKGLAGTDDERGGDAPDQLKGKYRDPKSSGLKVTIKPERNALPTLELTN